MAFDWHLPKIVFGNEALRQRKAFFDAVLMGYS